MQMFKANNGYCKWQDRISKRDLSEKTGIADKKVKAKKKNSDHVF